MSSRRPVMKSMISKQQLAGTVVSVVLLATAGSAHAWWPATTCYGRPAACGIVHNPHLVFAYGKGRAHARATILHEIGHALGLAYVNTFSIESGGDLPMSGGTGGHEHFFPDDMQGLVAIYDLYAFAAQWNNFFV